MSDIFKNFYRDKKIIITGHTGFKGGWLSFWLHQLGAEVTGYGLGPPTVPSFFKIIDLKKKITSIVGDIRDKKNLTESFQQYQPEIVFHMAAQPLVRYSYLNPIETYETNVMGTLNVLEACRSIDSVRAVLIITSDKCYRNTDKKIYAFQENDPMGGDDPYSSSKGCAELITHTYLQSYFNPSDYERHKISLASVRAGNVLGGGDWAKDRLIPDCISALIEKHPIHLRYPYAIRPWQHVLDPLFGYLRLAECLYKHGYPYSGAWNFGPDAQNEELKTVHWVAEKIATLWGDNTSVTLDKNNHPTEAQFLSLNCTKAKNLLKWQPLWNIERTLNYTTQWYKAFIQNEDMYQYTIQQIKTYEDCLQDMATI